MLASSADCKFCTIHPRATTKWASEVSLNVHPRYDKPPRYMNLKRSLVIEVCRRALQPPTPPPIPPPPHSPQPPYGEGFKRTTPRHRPSRYAAYGEGSKRTTPWHRPSGYAAFGKRFERTTPRLRPSRYAAFDKNSLDFSIFYSDPLFCF